VPNVVTPHIGGASRETLRRGAGMGAAAVASVVSEDVPDLVLNPEVLARQETAP
jgi:phosphoglycerate dehydrogenase-like enzyme